jgi:hypothetical protein
MGTHGVTHTAGSGGITREKALRAAGAGVVGTIAFDLFGLVMGLGWDIPGLLGERIGGGLFVGVLAHYANGILLAIIFAGLAPLFVGPLYLRAVQFITIQVVFGVWLFMMPVMGMGALGLKMGAMMPVMVLVRHWVYAVVMGLVYARMLGESRSTGAH